MKCNFCCRTNNTASQFCSETCRIAHNAYQKLTGKGPIDESSFDEDPEIALQARDDAASETRDQRIARLKAECLALREAHVVAVGDFHKAPGVDPIKWERVCVLSETTVAKIRETLITIIGAENITFVRDNYNCLDND